MQLSFMDRFKVCAVKTFGTYIYHCGGKGRFSKTLTYNIPNRVVTDRSMKICNLEVGVAIMLPVLSPERPSP
jgi:hypothetical protein